MMKLTVLPNIPYGECLSVSKDIIETLKNEDAILYFPIEMEKYITKSDKVVFDEYETIIEICDIIIAVGGDGSVTKYASDAAIHSKPILGINAGHLGFLSGLEKTEISKLTSILKGEYKLRKRMMLYAQLFNEKGEQIYAEYCVNDAVVGRAHSPRMVDISIELDGKAFSKHRADGVIFSTPTGSTAYSMSAGGPVVDPHIECILVTPVCSHSLNARSIVCSSESTLIIKNNSETNDIRPLYLTTDSREAVEVPYGGFIKIVKAQKSARFISLKQRSFYEVLKDKIIERNIG